MTRSILILPFLLAACADASSNPTDTCDAEGYRGLIGTNIAAVTLPASPDLRVYGPNDAVTFDYRPGRTNIVLDSAGIVVDVTCG